MGSIILAALLDSILLRNISMVERSGAVFTVRLALFAAPLNFILTYVSQMAEPVLATVTTAISEYKIINVLICRVNLFKFILALSQYAS